MTRRIQHATKKVGVTFCIIIGMVIALNLAVLVIAWALDTIGSIFVDTPDWILNSGLTRVDFLLEGRPGVTL